MRSSFPTTTDEVAAAVRIANNAGVPFTARGAGTGLSGGAIAAEGGLIIAMNKMNRILELDIENRCAVVEPGVVNLWISDAAEPHGVPLRARPVQPESMHHRRKCRREQRRPAHLKTRRHDEPCHGA